MYIYYPVILMGATVIFIFLPAPAIYHRSRAWFLYANVSTVYRNKVNRKCTEMSSGAYCFPDYTLSSSAISFSEICSAR